MTFWVLTFIAEMLEVKGTLYFFDTFMEKRDGGYRNRYRFFVYNHQDIEERDRSGIHHGGMDRNVKMYPDYTGYVFPESGLL